MALLPSLIAQFTSFLPGPRLIDGSDLANLVNGQYSTATGLVAAAGGGQANALQLTAHYNKVVTVATTNDSVKLPLAIPGSEVWINNAGANTLAVFGASSNPNSATGAGDTISATNSVTQQPTTTGVTQATTKLCVYICTEAGQWKQGTMA